MFYGQWDLVVDDKWRLRIPSELSYEIGEKVLIFECGERIQIKNLLTDMSENDYPYVVVVKDNIKGKRILIPKRLRGSKVFLSGRNVLMLGKGDYIEITSRK
ncbi:MAG: hypothetical protein ACLFNR_02855 [Candidatus Paceibacterota bacterium]